MCWRGWRQSCAAAGQCRVEPIDLSPYRFDTALARVSVDDRDADLTQREFDLALYLFRRHGRIVSREALLENVWMIAANVPTRTVDTHISRLRRKLGLDGTHGWRLVAVYQHGYRQTPQWRLTVAGWTPPCPPGRGGPLHRMRAR